MGTNFFDRPGIGASFIDCRAFHSYSTARPLGTGFVSGGYLFCLVEQGGLTSIDASAVVLPINKSIACFLITSNESYTLSPLDPALYHPRSSSARLPRRPHSSSAMETNNSRCGRHEFLATNIIAVDLIMYDASNGKLAVCTYICLFTPPSIKCACGLFI